MTFLLEKMERANAVSGSKYLTDCIAAIKSLEASIKGDDFDEHAKNITTALGLMPRMFIGDYFPVKRGTEFPDMCFHFSNGKIMKKTMPQDFLLPLYPGLFLMISDFDSNPENVQTWYGIVTASTAGRGCKSVMHFLTYSQSARMVAEGYECYKRGFDLAVHWDNPVYKVYFAALIRQYAITCKKKKIKIPDVTEARAEIAAWCPKIAHDIMWTVPSGPGNARYDSWMDQRKELLENEFTCASCNTTAAHPKRCTCKKRVYCSKKCQKAHWKRSHRNEHYEVLSDDQ